MTDPAPTPAEISLYTTTKHTSDFQPASEDGAPEDSSCSTDLAKKNLEKNPSLAKNDEREYLTGLKLLFVLSGVTLVCFLVMLDTSIISTAIPRMTSEFHSLGDIGWYGSSYQMASACLQPLAGRVFFNFSTKQWTFMGFFFVFELGSLLCGIANSSKMFIIARAVAGIGSAGLMNGALTIISSCAPLHKSPRLIGVMMGLSQLGTIGGPLLGGAFTEYLNWRWCFYINLPVGALVAIFLSFIKIPDQVAKPSIRLALDTIIHQLDLIGFVLFSPAALQLLLALEYGKNNNSWGSATVIGLFSGAAATFIIFLLWEHRQGDQAMIPLRLVARTPVWTSCLVIMAIFAITLCSSYYLPIYFQAIKNNSPMMSGVSTLPGILSQLLVAVASGVLIEKMGYYLPWTIFGGVFTSIGSGLLSTLNPDTQIGKWIGYQILSGAGRGAAFQTPLIAVQNTIPHAQVSIAMSILMFTQTLSGAIFLTAASAIFDSGLKSFVPEYAQKVDPQTIISTGATGIQDAVSSGDLSGVLVAYSKSISYVFIMSAAVGVLIVVFSFGMGWKDIRRGKSAPEK
ncbi:hypothetical protein N7517_007496 [Penicillium concentricum]|uniref:Major facilitator superfamily (MFS) profile domain-containing protein n=1 Tax=Penicillium concentricum TaxID=293559 RepID=A0A9W9VDH4_9EURO|nr:uncharacterized protein N7517_007496 [Penicillium concentricum]KAJ5375490.1 hypothetical protein N7517_007496 [Penicillium concentricum]